jgi:hypothetical protein
MKDVRLKKGSKPAEEKVAEETATAEAPKAPKPPKLVLLNIDGSPHIPEGQDSPLDIKQVIIVGKKDPIVYAGAVQTQYIRHLENGDAHGRIWLFSSISNAPVLFHAARLAIESDARTHGYRQTHGSGMVRYSFHGDDRALVGILCWITLG